MQATLLGTLAVWWAMAALGFFVAAFPGLTVVGFTAGLTRPAAAAAALMAASLPGQAGWAPLPAWAAPFQPGVWLWCPLVLNLAALIASDSRWAAGAADLPPAAVLAQLPLRVRLRLLARWAVQVGGWLGGRGSRGAVVVWEPPATAPWPPQPSSLPSSCPCPTVCCRSAAQPVHGGRHAGVRRAA